MSVAIIQFGMYKGSAIQEVPLDYLFWLFPRLKAVPSGKQGDPGQWHQGNAGKLYEQILEFFLAQDIRVVCNVRKHKGHGFYFLKYKKYYPSGEQMPFLVCDWRGTNSKGNHVYETEAHGVPRYIVHEDNRFYLSKDYVSHRYVKNGRTMVYEKNPNYYFVDGYGRIMQGAYLMRKPYIPEGWAVGNFSDNMRIDELKLLNE